MYYGSLSFLISSPFFCLVFFVIMGLGSCWLLRFVFAGVDVG